MASVLPWLNGSQLCTAIRFSSSCRHHWRQRKIAFCSSQAASMEWAPEPLWPINMAPDIEIPVESRGWDVGFSSRCTPDIHFPSIPIPILTMRLSILFLAASAASASVIRSYVVKLPASAFPKFNTLSLEDAINGVDLLLGGNHTHSEPAAGSCPAPYTEPWQLYTPSLPAATSTDASEVGTPTFPATTSAGGDKLVTVPAINSPTGSTTVLSSAATITAVNSSAAASTITTSTSATPTPTPTIGVGSCMNPQIRYEWSSYSTANRKKFVAAIKCLVNKPPSGNFPPATNRFEDLARLHQIYMPDVHGNPEFLVWHRYFLWTFEQLLQVECGLDIPMPWWDETKVAGDFAASDLFTNDYFGALNGPDSEGDPTCVTTGVFGSMIAHIGPGTSNIPHCLSRSWDTSETANCNTNFVNTCNSRASYTDMESCSEDG